jgi:hypothetical protein
MRSIEASIDGAACVLKGDTASTLLLDRKEVKLPFAPHSEGLGWNHTGTMYAALSDDRIHIMKRDGSKIAEVGVRQAKSPSSVGWASDGKALIREVYDVETKRLTVHYLDRLKDWRLKFECDVQTCHFLSKGRFVSLGPMGAVMLFSVSGVTVLLDSTSGLITASRSTLLSVSPSGRYKVNRGKRSRRPGVTLLEIEEAGVLLRLIRLFGNFHGEARWSFDESRLSFLAGRDIDRRMWSGQAEYRLMTARIIDRHAVPVSMPGQNPTHFAWLSQSLIRRYLTS